MKTTINFYEGSYQFYSITTELNVSPDFIEMKLAIQYEYRQTNESLWASVHQGSREIARFKFEHGVGLKDITIKECPYVRFVDDGNGHDKDLIDAFNDAAQGFNESELLHLILRYHCDDSDLADIADLLIERRG